MAIKINDDFKIMKIELLNRIKNRPELIYLNKNTKKKQKNHVIYFFDFVRGKCHM